MTEIICLIAGLGIGFILGDIYVSNLICKESGIKYDGNMSINSMIAQLKELRKT